METSTNGQPNFTLTPRPWKLRLILGLAVLFVAGAGATYGIGRWADRAQRDDLYEVANLVRYSADATLIQQLTGTEADRTSEAFLDIQKTFVGVGDASKKIRYIYLMGRKEQEVFFFLDSQPSRYQQPDQPALAVPGEIYEDVTDEILDVFFSGTSTVVGPETDKWGTFVSALVPVRDSANRIVALLGVDMDATDFISNVRSRQYLPALATMFLMALYATIILLSSRQHHPSTKQQQQPPVTA